MATVEKQKQVLASQTLMELHTTLNRYCNPDTTFLCERKFGFIFSKKLVEEEIMERILLEEKISDDN